MKALITGASGFVGPYLARHLRSLGYEVWGASPSGRASADYHAVALDIRDRGAASRVVRELAPRAIYHLAGITRPALGLVNEFYEVNLMGSLNVLEAAQESGAEVLVVGSAYAYGSHSEIITETTLLEPLNPYGASKAAADLAALSYAGAIKVVRARPFNHSGPGQLPDFLLPSLVKQLARIEAGLAEPVIRLGNLDSVRDFSDVRDVVRAYGLLLEHGRSGAAYNVASGRGVSVRELVHALLELSEAAVVLEVEEARLRSGDIPFLVGSAERARTEVGWTPDYSLEGTLRDMLDFERQALQ